MVIIVYRWVPGLFCQSKLWQPIFFLKINCNLILKSIFNNQVKQLAGKFERLWLPCEETCRRLVVSWYNTLVHTYINKYEPFAVFSRFHQLLVASIVQCISTLLQYCILLVVLKWKEEEFTSFSTSQRLPASNGLPYESRRPKGGHRQMKNPNDERCALKSLNRDDNN